jgi:hypothetical protein
MPLTRIRLAKSAVDFADCFAIFDSPHTAGALSPPGSTVRARPRSIPGLSRAWARTIFCARSLYARGRALSPVLTTYHISGTNSVKVGRI